MPQDVEALEEEKSGSSQPISPRRHESQWLTTPQQIKNLFKKFPLRVYSPNELPQRAATDRTYHKLYVFTTDEAARLGLPSFNPSCLKWQAYLKFKDIEFHTVASNNHASPTGALPFLIPFASVPYSSESRLAIPVGKLQQWAHKETASGGTKPKHARSVNSASLQNSEANKLNEQAKHETLHAEKSPNPPSEEPSNLRYRAYMSLLDNRVRNAWLYFLYLEPSNFATVATPLYINPCSSNFLVRATLAYNLRAAAKSELLKQSPVIDVESLYVECERAFSALSELLGEDQYFFALERPGLFDASVFAYTNILLDEQIVWQERRVIEGLRRCENLVRHRARISDAYF